MFVRHTELFEVVSYRNSTSNHNIDIGYHENRTVVSYRNSTSNHNVKTATMILVMLYLIEILHQTTTSLFRAIALAWLYLIEILHQTTTDSQADLNNALLYLIEILHQTTTFNTGLSFAVSLYLIEILHQTTTLAMSFRNTWGCILSKFYIKPQRRASY